MVSRPVVVERVFRQFRRVIAAVVIYNDQVAQQSGMSASESQFLHLLEIHGPLTPSELSRYSRLTTGTVTGVIDRLEQLGFAHRERHPTDRRKVVVAADAAAIQQKLAPLFAEKSQNLFGAIDQFTVAELETILRFLTVVADAG